MMSVCYLNGEYCPICGISYKKFRCSLSSFSEVKGQLYKAGETDSSKWRQKRRKSVLGYWHQIKKTEWEYHLAECVGYAGLEDDKAVSCY